jgi:cyclin B
VIGPNIPNAQQPSAALTSRNTKSNQGLADSESQASSTLSLRRKQSKGNSTTNEKDPKSDTSESAVGELFQARIKADNKKRRREMVFVDQMDMRDPQMNAENAAPIFFNLRKQEEELGIKADYLTAVQLKSEVKDTSRAFLVEWIIDVHRKFRLMPESLYLTVLIVDRYLSLVQIKKSQLHILGLTSILVATKYEEIYPPSLQELLGVSENKFSRRDVINMEHDMLTTLEFAVQAPSAYRFLERYNKLCTAANDDQTFFFAQYI